MMKRVYVILPILCCVVCLVSRSHAQQEDIKLAEDAYNVFRNNCLTCHGQSGSFRDILFIDSKTSQTIIDDGIVVPWNPEASELFRRITSPNSFERMPLGGDKLRDDEISTIKRWIEAGAPDWKNSPSPSRPFISYADVLSEIEKDIRRLPNFDQPFTRYFTLTHLYNAGVSDADLETYRVALSKLINSLSWESEVIVPTPIDATRTVFRIDLRDYQWKKKIWDKLQHEYPYDIQVSTLPYAQFIRVDWFIARASIPPLYHRILELPMREHQLEDLLDIDVDENLEIAPGRRVWRAGFNNSGVSGNNRIVERHRSPHGAYWKSYDFSENVGDQNIFQHPLDFDHAGGEMIFNLPNGLQAYFLANDHGRRLDEAPIDIVFNRDADDPVIRNGLSCMSCHTEGIKPFKDQVRPVIERTLNAPYDRELALALYSIPEDMDYWVEKDRQRYKEAVEATGGVIDGRDPVVTMAKEFEGTLDVAYAAAELGLTQSNLVERIRTNRRLQELGLTVLVTEDGTVKRDAWEEQFDMVVDELRIELPFRQLTQLGRIKWFTLQQNYPNPFNAETWIPYYLAKAAPVTVKIYDITGNMVRLLEIGRQPEGVYLDQEKAVYWDGLDNLGQSVASGIYFYQLVAGDFSQTKKMVILE